MPGAMAMLHSTPVLWAVLAFTMEAVPLTATGPHRELASVMLTLMLMLSMDTVVLVLAPVDSSVSPVSTLAMVATLPVDSLTSSASGLLMPGATALGSTDTASGPLMLTVSPTATGPHRELTVLD